jgi:L-ascorbate metabolism protein UlaG (beta-lactamase superfamily)
MNETRLFSRPNLVLEPLVDRWYAWSHLVSPATAARNITERHLKIMASYIGAPHVHAAAASNPSLLGGPFMDYRGNEVERISDLRQKTSERRRSLIELSASLEELEKTLAREANGYSLEPLYAKVPANLKGFVELTYDLRNQSSFRLIEPLLYRSEFYQPDAQSVALSLTSGDDRPFVLSTPRLPDPELVDMPVPFDHKAIDRIARTTYEPISSSELDELSDLAPSQRKLLRSFFTPDLPPPFERYSGPGARWRYFGHACVLIETKSTSILVDPVLSYTYESDISRYTYRDLPPVIDFVLITHNHQDHILFETLLQIRHRVRTIVVPRNGRGSLQDPSLRLVLEHCGFRNVVELAEMQELKFENGAITMLPFLGEHGDLDVQTKTAYHLRIGKHSIVFAADSANIEPELYCHLFQFIGAVDVLFLGMECDGAPVSWVYGPLFHDGIPRAMDQTRRLAGSDSERALRIIEDLHCKEVYIYAMGQEPWLAYVMAVKYTEQSNPIIQSNRVLKACEERGIVAERLFGEKEILLP